ncbi:MAG: nitroreductase family deazaflavin-dependent oxidoreductase [Dehalococcoidia bacterium]|nr:nitroreductase family deazaflavin-dependent oxidoreductase [Dehalococcoidia bacterium]
MTSWNEHNLGVIEQFRAKGGRDGARPLLLLTTTGAKSGRPHTTPLMYLADGDRFAVIASKGGAANHPDWYWNLVANPSVRVEVGGESFETQARVAEPEERDRLFALQAERYPFFAGYQKKVKRRIPVVVLQRRTRQSP